MSIEVILQVNGRRKAGFTEFNHGQATVAEFLFSEAFDAKTKTDEGVFAIEPEVLEQRLRPALYLYKANTREEQKAKRQIKRLVTEYRLAKEAEMPTRLMIYF